MTITPRLSSNSNPLVGFFRLIGEGYNWVCQHSGDFGRGFNSLVEKPTHFINWALIALGVLGSFSVVTSLAAKLSQTSEAEMSIRETFLLAGAAFLAASFFHFTAIYHSLFQCEDDPNFKQTYSEWIDTFLEKTLRYISIFALLVFSGKIVIAELLEAQSVGAADKFAFVILSGSATFLFFIFISWATFSVFIKPKSESLFDRLRNVIAYLICDVLAFVFWLQILLYHLDGDNSGAVRSITMWGFIYAVFTFIFRFGAIEGGRFRFSNGGVTIVVAGLGLFVGYSLLHEAVPPNSAASDENNTMQCDCTDS